MKTMYDIPIRNIYYLVLYAWNRVRNKEMLSDKGMEKVGSVNEVLLELFLTEVDRLTKMGLRKEYVTDIHASRFIKGKIQINETIRQSNKLVISEFDEFHENHRLNQIIKAYLQRLYYVTNISEENKKQIRVLLLHFESTETIGVTPILLRNINYNRLTIDYRFPIELGQLIYEQAIPNETGKGFIFYDILKDEEVMNQIFEQFIYNYYNVHYSYKVVRRQHDWGLTPIGDSDLARIPKMLTDVEITTPSENIIIDAKYYSNAFTKNYQKERFRSGHMYQMAAYMRVQTDDEKQKRGILMYPSNGYEFYERYRDKDGSILEFKTINLAKKWEEIEKDLAMIF